MKYLLVHFERICRRYEKNKPNCEARLEEIFQALLDVITAYHFETITFIIFINVM